MEPKLPAPKPDQAIGWTSKLFDKFDARALSIDISSTGPRAVRSFAAPGENMHWPVFTVEGKGAAGQLRKAQRQNLYNAAIMINNLLELKKMVTSKDSPFGRALVMSMELTAEVVQLNCHWAIRSAEGDIIFYGKTLGSWSLHCPRPDT